MLPPGRFKRRDQAVSEPPGACSTDDIGGTATPGRFVGHASQLCTERLGLGRSPAALEGIDSEPEIRSCYPPKHLGWALLKPSASQEGMPAI
jgi:hypothetical protein